MNKVTVEEVSSPGCHNCAIFREYWDKERTNWPNVEYKEISILDPEGQAAVEKHQIFASPGIIINGELFSTGGVNQGDFIKKLKELSGS